MQNNLSKCNFTAVSYVYCNCKLYHFAFFSGDNGMLNKTILPFFGKEAINWYSESKYWPVILVIVNTWKGVGYGCLIYISSISGIDPSFYEAAELDGASKWKQIRYITLPSIMPSVIT